MKKLVLAILIPVLLPIFGLIYVPTAEAKTCNFTVSPAAPVSNQSFTMSFPDYTSANSSTYSINFDTTASNGSTRTSASIDSSGVASFPAGLVGPADDTFHVRGFGVIICDGTLTIAAAPSNLPNTSAANPTAATCKNGQVGIDTDLGCIPTNPQGLANAIFSIILGIAGGVAIILIIVGGFKVSASQGNVDALTDGRDMITKAITGLAFILLASTILSIIGLDILGLKFAFGPTGIFPIAK